MNNFLYKSKIWLNLIEELHESKIEFLNVNNSMVPFLNHEDLISNRAISLPNTDFTIFLDENEKFQISDLSNKNQKIIKIISNQKIELKDLQILRDKYYYLSFESYDNFIKNCNKNFKRNLKKNSQIYKTQDLDSFYDFYFTSRIKNFNRIPYPKKYFYLLKKYFKDKLIIYKNFQDNELLSITIFLEFEKKIYYIAAATNKDKKKPCSHKPFAEIIKYAESRGIKTIMLGRGADMFKESLGAKYYHFSQISIKKNNYFVEFKKVLTEYLISIYLKFFLKYGIGKSIYEKIYKLCK